MNEVEEIIEHYMPGAICGVKQLLASGNIAHTTSLVASTDCEMLEFNLDGVSQEAFFNALAETPRRCE